MDFVTHLITYGALAVFLAAVIVRFVRIQRLPLHVRWEVYPVPHEGARAEHGGSRLEDTDWWKNERKPDKVMELRFMIPEMVLLKALWEHNRRLWFRSFPFHFGLYLLAGFAGLLALGALLGLFEISLGLPFTLLTTGIGFAGAVLAALGALGLWWMRLTDAELKPYTTFSHHFNLLFFLVALGLLFGAWGEAGWDLAPFTAFFGTLMTGRFAAFEGTPLMVSTVVVWSLLLAYIPLTHMSHFFVKWFTWHKIRWDDEPNVRGGRIEKMIQKALEAPVSWSAPHIGADGKKSWGDIAVEELPEQ